MMWLGCVVVAMVAPMVVRGAAPVVQTTLGAVRGVEADDGDYYMYMGMPYARVDEDNPFGASSPHPPYGEDIFEADDDTAMCPQIEEYNSTLAGSLDCLRVNVYVPTTASADRPLPVLVYIYGGRFEIGFYGRFMFGPKYLIRHDVIVVTLNYRIGPYGFMCLAHPRVPGNQGLKDQLLALRWIRDNIGHFNGDPDKITISGNSAGSMSVDLQLNRRNDGEKLFDKAILQSGTSLGPSFPAPARDAPIQIAEKLGFRTANLSEALDFLSTIEPLQVIDASNQLNIIFRPCVEQPFEGVESFITENWVAMEDVPTVRDMPILIGFNDDEGLTRYAVMGSDHPNAVNDALSAAFDMDREDFTGMSDIVRHFYFGDEAVSDATIQGAIDLTSDLSFIHPSHRSVEKYLRNGAQKVYLYLFAYSGERNFIKHRLNITEGGAAHADEISYLFDISYMPEPTPEDQLVLDAMTAMWTNFVKYDDPTPTTTALLPYKWLPVVSGSSLHYMTIDLALSVGTRPLAERMTFWDAFYEANGHLQLFLHQNSARSNPTYDDAARSMINIFREMMPY